MKNLVLEQVLVTFHVVLYFWNVKIFFLLLKFRFYYIPRLTVSEKLLL